MVLVATDMISITDGPEHREKNLGVLPRACRMGIDRKVSGFATEIFSRRPSLIHARTHQTRLHHPIRENPVVLLGTSMTMAVAPACQPAHAGHNCLLGVRDYQLRVWGDVKCVKTTPVRRIVATIMPSKKQVRLPQ